MCLVAVLAEDCPYQSNSGVLPPTVPGHTACVESRVTAVIVVVRSCSGKAAQPLVPWGAPLEEVH